MVAKENMTPGYWYVKYYQRHPSNKEVTETYRIVEVIKHGDNYFEVALAGSDEPYTLEEFEFIKPVPSP